MSADRSALVDLDRRAAGHRRSRIRWTAPAVEAGSVAAARRGDLDHHRPTRIRTRTRERLTHELLTAWLGFQSILTRSVSEASERRSLSHTHRG